MAPGDLAGRRRRRVAIAVLLALLPVRPGTGLEARAATLPASPPGDVVLVTAGEHGEFSRVVFALGADRSYRTEPEPAGLRVVFPGSRPGFEYGGVYPGRRAHRVIMAEPGSDAEGASFRLRFGCDCSARTFVLEDRLVVDIFDGSSSDGQPSRSSRAARGGGAVAPAPSEPVAGAATDPPAHAAAPGGAGDPSNQGHPRAEFLQRVESLSSAAQGTESGAVPDGVGFNPDHLQRMIAWAIEQGHLTGASEADDHVPSPHRPEEAQPAVAATGADSTEPPAVEPVQPPAVEPVPPPAELSAPPPVAQEPAPAASEASVAVQGGAPGSASTSSCPEGAALDMAVLGGTGAFGAELAERQDALSRALAAGQRIAEEQHALAGFYLARLMPQEALRLLRTADREAPTPTERWLGAVALILADRTSTPAVRALQAWSCPGADIELWQAVLRAADGPIARQTFDSDALRLRLAAYPPELRVELALRLAEAGIDANAPAAIARLLDMVEQAAPADEALARLLFLRGRLAAARGDFAGAEASWRKALDLPGEGGLRATLAVLESDLEHDVLDEAGTLAALERLAYDWHRRVAKVQRAHGLPREGASTSEALAHYFGANVRGFEHERQLYRQTIRILARELERLDSAHPEAHAALELLGEPTSPQPAGPRA
jgi:hypothetical protein